MLLLDCPCCGQRGEETEFHCGGEAHITREGPSSDDAAFEHYMFERVNPRGVHFERWRHVAGCGKWFHAARDTVTLEVWGTYPAQTSRPPEELLEKIRAARPGFKWRDIA
ncbi:sarcosine oxidase subunit delta [Pseudooceanicola antarcticus]|uniref:Sarcosine oxidase subunit delta n=1 Tax=Pseudooceanicola antarcticus TaxID=1247613 RepID=A0A285J7R1_9RHOB|nr:sarcosine oxidase subunit delta [Pseudooceanicola antarcticus]PJE27116.1 sarcosine oxidase subunit delta [Pseudooceanicola antarcticus]SNY56369.1 sarcosine oxidase subunit delta [Pseudooceanicola antarcticus]